MLKKNDLLRRCLFTAMILFIYALGQQITLPMFDAKVAGSFLNKDTVWQFVGMATGGQTRLPTLLSVGIMPYMTGMIVWSAVSSLDIPAVNNLSPKMSNVIQTSIALVVGVLQSFLYVYYLRSTLRPLYLPESNTNVAFPAAVLLLTAGGMFTILIGNENNNRGIGGMMVMILPGLVLSLPSLLRRGFGQSPLVVTPAIAIATIVFGLIFVYFVVKLNRAEYRLVIQRSGIENSLYESYMPIPLLTAGAMPFMFSSMMFTMPRQIVMQMNAINTDWGKSVLAWTDYNRISGVATYALVIIALGYAFGLMNFQPSKAARQLKEGGDYIFDYIPGEPTEKLLMHHFSRLTFASNLILLAIGVVPLIFGLFIRGAANYSPFLGNIFIVVTISYSISESVVALYNKNRYRLFDSL